MDRVLGIPVGCGGSPAPIRSLAPHFSHASFLSLLTAIAGDRRARDGNFCKNPKACHRLLSTPFIMGCEGTTSPRSTRESHSTISDWGAGPSHHDGDTVATSVKTSNPAQG